MRDLFSKLATGSMIAGAALLVAACGSNETANTTDTNMTDVNAVDPAMDGTMNDMTAVDATMGDNMTTDTNMSMDANMATDNMSNGM